MVTRAKLPELATVIRTKGDMQPHVQRLHDLVVEMGARNIVELGVRKGASSAAFLHAVHQTDGHLTSVELTEPQPFVDTRWSFIGGDDMSPGVIAQVPDDIDVLFIDTTHRWNHTAAELDVYGRMVRDGGVVACHDTDLPGVMEPLRAFWRERGVEWREWRESHGLAFVTVGPTDVE